MPKGSHIWGLGRRKTSTARVRLAPGTGKVTINHKPIEEYLTIERRRRMVLQPLELTQTREQYDIHVNVNGGGETGQAGAIVLGIARALVKAEPHHQVQLRSHGLLTRDSRMVERKKYGLHKARRGCQFSKR